MNYAFQTAPPYLFSPSSTQTQSAALDTHTERIKIVRGRKICRNILFFIFSHRHCHLSNAITNEYKEKKNSTIVGVRLGIERNAPTRN